MSEIKFLDANCVIGRGRKAYPFSVTSKEEIKEELLRCNVEKAFCHHILAQEYDAMDGNRILNEEIAEDSFFAPAYVMLPNHAEDFLSNEQFYGELKETGVRLVKMFPAEHNFCFSVWNMEESLSFLSDIRMPLLLSLKQVQINELYQVLSAFPKLPVIVSDAGYSMDRSLMLMMKQFPELYIETSNYSTLDGIEYVTGKFGASRLIFGSGAPTVATGAAIAKILYARISDAEKEQIAHGNLEHLTERVVL